MRDIYLSIYPSIIAEPAPRAMLEARLVGLREMDGWRVRWCVLCVGWLCAVYMLCVGREGFAVRFGRPPGGGVGEGG